MSEALRHGGPRAAASGRPVLKHAVLIAVAFCMLYPLLWMLASSFRSSQDIFSTRIFRGKTQTHMLHIFRRFLQ